MNQRVSVVAVAGICWLAVGLAPAAEGELQPDLIPASALARADLAKYWQAGAALWPGERVIRLKLIDENLYCMTDRGRAVALHADTGLLLWSIDLAASGDKVLGPTHTPDAVMFTTDTKVVQCSRRKGEVIYNVDLPFAVSSAAVGDGDRAYLGSTNGRFYCVRLYDRIRLWQVRTDRAVSGTPALEGRLVYFAAEDGHVYACRAVNKQELFQRQLSAGVFCDMVCRDNALLVASRDRSLYCYNAITGRLRWQFRTSGPLIDTPVLAGDTVFFFGRREAFFAATLAEGTQRWKRDDLCGFIARQDDTSYLRDTSGDIVAVETATGKTEAVIPARGVPLAAINDRDGTLFVGRPDGAVMSIRPIGVPYLRRDDLRKVLQPAVEAPAPVVEVPVEPVAPPTPAAPTAPDPLRSADDVPPVAGGVLEESGDGE